jgi:hypothetical protein
VALSGGSGQPSEAEVQDLDRPVRGEGEVLGLEVAVDDPCRVRGVSPSSSSKTAYAVPSDDPASKRATTFGWLSAASARASRSKRRRRSGSAACSRESTFRAT